MTNSRVAKLHKSSSQTKSSRRCLLAVVLIISDCISLSEAFTTRPNCDQPDWNSNPNHHAETHLLAPDSTHESQTIYEDCQPSNDTKQAFDLIRGRKENELPELTSSQNPLDETHLVATDRFFNHADRMQDSLTVGNFGLMALVARGQAIVYADLYMHKFDNPEIMHRSAGSRVDNELCLKQLASLAERTDRQQEEKFASRDLNLFRLMDTWGRMPAGLLLGNVFFHGAHDECVRMRLDTPQGPQATRYCVLHLRHKHWPRLDKHDLLSLKTGVCLPASCDSTNYKNKFQLIMRMAEYQMRRHELGEVKFDSLYCLPDEDSPHQQIWRHPKSVLVLVLLFAWLLALAWATRKHNRFIERTASRCDTDGLNEQVPSSDEAPSESQEDGGEFDREQNLIKICEVLSITNNLRLLLKTSKDCPSKKTVAETRNESELESAPKTDYVEALEKRHVDLSCIEGVKVVAMSYVIMGHVLMCFMALSSNIGEVTARSALAFLLAKMAPAFAVNSFFTITGLLTSYSIFKRNKQHNLITSPIKWFFVILYRYLRIAPMYALAVLYCKHLARFTGSGPLWDYATSSLSQRRACELEPWFYTLTFTSNFIPPMQHCIPGGWYLSNDFQFAMVTPFFLLALYKRPRLGELLLVAGAVAGFLAGFQSIFLSEIDDLRPIANFAAHGFKTYVSHLSFNYTQPQYRIPAYLIGLLIGFKLHQYEQEQEKPSRDGFRWPPLFRELAPWLCLFMVVGSCATPNIASHLTFTKWGARFMVALITPGYHVMFALAVGLYLLLATTGHGNRRLNALLSAPQWKPLARLSLCAVLVNVETINYIVQGDTSQRHVTDQFHFAINCVCICATYLVAAFAYILFEAPLRGLSNIALEFISKRISTALKRGGRATSDRPARRRLSNKTM